MEVTTLDVEDVESYSFGLVADGDSETSTEDSKLKGGAEGMMVEDSVEGGPPVERGSNVNLSMVVPLSNEDCDVTGEGPGNVMLSVT